jgi:pyruvate/2-oxoglutarate dehydrogenase complex dihydrolipoamide dehydrogenase (E3) component
VVISEKDGQEQRHVCDAVLFAVGRQPNTSGLGLQEIGVELHKDKDSIVVDDLQRTNFPNIYACGDVSSAFRFTHIAGAQGWRAAANAVLAPFSKQRFDDAIVPWITFTDPAVGRVGLSEAEAKETETPFEITRIDLADNDRAIADGTAYGTVKVLTEPGRDTILGATVVGAQAAEILPEFVLAMRHGLGLGKLLDTIHVYPTASEAVVQVASAWKRAHASPRQLAWAERYLQLRRSPGKTAWLVGAVLAVPLLGLGIWAALAWLGRGGGD